MHLDSLPQLGVTFRNLAYFLERRDGLLHAVSLRVAGISKSI